MSPVISSSVSTALKLVGLHLLSSVPQPSFMFWVDKVDAG